MKKILSIIAVLFCLSATAQKIDSVKASIQIQPVVVNVMVRDTAYQLIWSANSLSRDTSLPVPFYVAMYDRKGIKVIDFNVIIPSSVIAQWGTSDTIIDDYILNKYGLKKR